MTGNEQGIGLQEDIILLTGEVQGRVDLENDFNVGTSDKVILQSVAPEESKEEGEMPSRFHSLAKSAGGLTAAVLAAGLAMAGGATARSTRNNSKDYVRVSQSSPSGIKEISNVFGRSGIYVNEHSYGLTQLGGAQGPRGPVGYATHLVFSDHIFYEKSPKCVSVSSSSYEGNSEIYLSSGNVSWTKCGPLGESGYNNMSFKNAYQRANTTPPPIGTTLNFAKGIQMVWDTKIAPEVKLPVSEHAIYGVANKIVGSINTTSQTAYATVDFNKPVAKQVSANSREVKSLNVDYALKHGRMLKTIHASFYNTK